MAQPIRTIRPEKMGREPDVASRTFASSLQTAKPLTLKSLLEEPVEFVDSRRKTDEDAIPYTPINVKVRVLRLFPSRARIAGWLTLGDTRPYSVPEAADSCA